MIITPSNPSRPYQNVLIGHQFTREFFMFAKRISRSVFATLYLFSQGSLAQSMFDSPNFLLAGGGRPISHAVRPSLNTVQLDAFVNQIMKEYGVPGVGLAIVQNGKVSYAKGYGVRNVSKGTPVTPNTQFPIGSVTKSFTALDMMVLVNEGLVNLDAPVTTYIPEFKLSSPASTRTVTVRNLLTHTTGLTRTDASTFNPKITVKDIIATAATTPLVGKPGEKFVYSNVNAIIAGEIIRRVSGQSWANFTQQRVFQPLGMNTATLSIDALKLLPDIATPHELDVKNGGSRPIDYLSLGADAAAGAVNASASEMARYMLFQLGTGSPLLSQASLNEMHKGQIAAPDSNLPGVIAQLASKMAKNSVRVPAPLVTQEQYGFYWNVENFLGEQIVQHAGNVTGATASVTLLPGQHAGVVILANIGEANTFMDVMRLHIAEVLLGRSGPNVEAVLQAQLKVLGQDNASIAADRQAARTYRPQPNELSALAGTFKSLADPQSTVVKVIDQRMLRLESGFRGVRFTVDLIPLGKNRFMATGQPIAGSVVKFTGGEDERAIEIEGLNGATPLAGPSK
ncbi:serine hydrolase domain-containing protein [Deinococcus marmoris]|nr:serine hydrolase domain-containing protein [Deinococcus marmoris]